MREKYEDKKDHEIFMEAAEIVSNIQADLSTSPIVNSEVCVQLLTDILGEECQTKEEVKKILNGMAHKMMTQLLMTNKVK